MKHKLLSLILALALLVSLGAHAFAASGSGFTDIADRTTAQDAETLRILGVVDGMADGKFVPNGTLTRAQFCKMAVIMMGAGDKEPTFRNRTIFSDVTSRHWARGYINLAASGEGAIIGGMGNGRFSPDTNITFAQAVTILVRLLGYSDSDTSMQWPEGYLDLAAKLGLTDGLNIASGSAITRAQAARLFCAMLSCNLKDGTSYLARFGSVTEDVILLNNNATAPDGSSGALYTSAGTFKTDADISDAYIGERGAIVVGANNRVVLFIPKDSSKKTVAVKTAEAGWFKDADGTRYTVSSDTVVYTGSETKSWKDVWLDAAEGSEMTIYFTAKGTVEAIFFATSIANDNVAVAMNEVKGNPFTSLLNGDTEYSIIKNGAEASVSDLRRYDVAVYDEAAHRLKVTDLKLTGYYENAYPSQSSPEKIKFLGHTFDVVPSALDSLQSFKIGDMMTLLFTDDLRVAGAVSATAVSGNAVGIVKSCSSEKASVELLTTAGKTLEISGIPVGSPATSINGELVTVSSYQKGYLTIRRLTESAALGALNLDKMTLGTAKLSPAVKIFDRAGKSALASVSADEIRLRSIPRSSVLYAHSDYAGRIDLVVLDDVTGSCFKYGLFRVASSTVSTEFGDITNRTACIENSAGSTAALRCSHMIRTGEAGGLAYSANGDEITSVVTLLKLANVSRTAFKTVNGETTLTVGSFSIPVAEDVQCYNAAAEVWFESLNDARAFSTTLTVYYDREPALGGQVRLVVAG